ncbi:TOBE domain-containing protein [Caenispirillum bisanense]|uniref:Molybdenum-pterin binding domain-containing protein n=1 Tax=Caenispirillum bisanense TaxID=414052 RepID=A0A286GIF3_9PROT|nr:TOBE domain-containing protein [Caenispirillum bisanense]SOD95315.1 molybdenum-pterin binding domain-containing protein [Caenispirillum bisanense]
MKISARNTIPGTITAIAKGPSTATVKIDVGNGLTVTSTITADAAADLGLKEGDTVTAIIKASDVLIGK